MDRRERVPERAPLTIRIGAECAFKVAGGGSFDRHWWRMRAGKWERKLVHFVERVSGPRTALYDIGAWCGPVTLIAAAKGARVVALEPDPVAFRALRGHLTLNGFDVDAREVAIGKERGTMRLYAHAEFGDSMTSAVVPSASWIEVETVRLEDLPRFDGICTSILKIDIEGMEYVLADDILDFCRDRKCAVSLSCHPRNLWLSGRREMSGFSARLQALHRTFDLIDRLRRARYVPEGSSYPLVKAQIVERCLLRPRVKNLDLLLLPSGAA